MHEANGWGTITVRTHYCSVDTDNRLCRICVERDEPAVVVEFEDNGFHDFTHNIAKARSMLGYNPEYDIVKIIDSAIEFRKSGRKRTPEKYIG